MGDRDSFSEATPIDRRGRCWLLLDDTLCTTWVARYRSLDRSSGWPHRPKDEQEHDGADEGDEDRSSQATKRNGNAESDKEPASDDGAKNAHHDVAQNAVPDTPNGDTGENARDQSDYEPGEKVHNVLDG